MSARRSTPKRYDQAYFDHWYRAEGFGAATRLDRKVAYAVGVAEYLLDRPVTSVLDVGCGEGPWHDAVAVRRPDATYLGLDPSPYAAARYGADRNVHLGGCVDLPALADAGAGPFDLIVCVDVAGYVPADELRAALDAMARMLTGVVLFEVFARGDDWVGDRVGFHDRPSSTYDRWFAEAGLVRIGPNLLCGDAVASTLAALERPRR